MVQNGKGISTTAVMATVVGGILAWSGLRGWKVSKVIKAFLSGEDPQKTMVNEMPVEIGGLIGSIVDPFLPGHQGPERVPGSPVPDPNAPGSPSKFAPSDLAPSTHPQENFKYAQFLAAQFGWNTQSELDAWYRLGMKESGWRNTAQNSHSTAFGIGQFLDSTWHNYGPKTSDPYLQTLYMAQYIRDRYGSPSKALAFHNKHNWY